MISSSTSLHTDVKESSTAPTSEPAEGRQLAAARQSIHTVTMLPSAPIATNYDQFTKRNSIQFVSLVAFDALRVIISRLSTQELSQRLSSASVTTLRPTAYRNFIIAKIFTTIVFLALIAMEKIGQKALNLARQGRQGRQQQQATANVLHHAKFSFASCCVLLVSMYLFDLHLFYCLENLTGILSMSYAICLVHLFSSVPQLFVGYFGRDATKRKTLWSILIIVILHIVAYSVAQTISSILRRSMSQSAFETHFSTVHLSRDAPWSLLSRTQDFMLVLIVVLVRYEQRKRLEDAWARADYIFQSIIQQIPTLKIWALDHEQRFLYAANVKTSDGSCVIGKKVFDVIQLMPNASENGARTFMENERQVLDGQNLHQTVITELPQGTTQQIRAVDMFRVPFRNPEDPSDIIGSLSITIDISERVRSERQLAESESRMNQIIACIPDRIFVVARDGTVRFVSRDGVWIDKNKAEKSNFLSFFPGAPKTQQKIMDLIAAVYDQKQTGVLQTLFSDSKNCLDEEDTDPEWLHRRILEEKFGSIRLRFNPLVARDGTVKGCIVAGFHNEQALNAVEQRRESEQIKNMATAKSRTIQILSHEIRNPLQSILGSLDLMMETTQLSEGQQEFLFDCKESARSLLEILNDVLDMEKIMSGKISLHLAPMSLLQMVEGCVKAYTAIATQRSQQLFMTFDTRIPQHLLVDSTKLGQVLNNLVSNSLKFFRRTDGTGYVHICAELLGTDESDPHAYHIKLSVKDNGIGISEQNLSKIFQPFVQVHSDNHVSNPGQFSGWGLGLSVCRQLIEQLMGGKLRATSVLGEGTTFSLELTLRPPAPAIEGTPLIVQPISKLMQQSKYSNAMLLLRTHTRDKEIQEVLDLVRDNMTRMLQSLGVSNIRDLSHETNSTLRTIISQQERSVSESTIVLVDECRLEDAQIILETGCRVIVMLQRNGSIAGVPTSDNVHTTRKPLKLTQLHALLLAKRHEMRVPRKPQHLEPAHITQHNVQFGTSQATVTTPSAASAPAAPENWLPPTSPGSSHQDETFESSQEPIRILVVDDLTLNQKIVKKLLARIPALSTARYTTAMNGQEAVDTIAKAEQPFDIVFMDLLMPLMDGWTATKNIRDFEQANNKPAHTIVAVTANADMETRERCFKVGFTDVFVKPILQEQLTEIVAKYVHVSKINTSKTNECTVK